jgi:hypothetical protein
MTSCDLNPDCARKNHHLIDDPQGPEHASCTDQVYLETPDIFSESNANLQ